jgi:hypothetical protein
LRRIERPFADRGDLIANERAREEMSMNRQNGSLSLFALALVVVAGCSGQDGTNAPVQSDSKVAETESPLKAESPSSCTQLVHTGNFYYADSSRTQLVGECSITCAEWIAGTAYLGPGGGAKCQGATTNYSMPYIQWCNGCQN